MFPRLQRVKETCVCKQSVQTHNHTHTQTPLWNPAMKADTIIKGNNSPADLQRSPLISIHVSFLSPSACQPLNLSVISDVSPSLSTLSHNLSQHFLSPLSSACHSQCDSSMHLGKFTFLKAAV